VSYRLATISHATDLATFILGTAARTIRRLFVASRAAPRRLALAAALPVAVAVFDHQRNSSLTHPARLSVLALGGIANVLTWTDWWPLVACRTTPWFLALAATLGKRILSCSLD
jgi:hypothetical protein